MKLRKVGSFLKLGKCRALFKNPSLVAQDLWGQNATRTSVKSKLGFGTSAILSPS